MFGIGTPELIVILVVALIVFGPEKLPQIAAQAGKAIRDFRQMSADLTGEFNRTLAFDEPPPAAALEPSPALSQETIAPQAWPATDGAADGQGAATGQNGHDAVTTPLAVETIPIDAPAPAATDTIWQEPVPTNGHSDESLLATKADPLAAVSLLEEPVRMLPAVPDGAAAPPASNGEAPAATETVAEPEPALVAAAEPPAPELTGEPVAVAEPAPVPDTVAPDTAAADTVMSAAVAPDTAPVAVADEPA
ncbi:MAG TPA: twin-arginine translocase TatA/TatE family subunit, partial [Thermomicrobiales bacterium]|nr:twin-arginine translocase TatA/TatE family subunit [Thermomicrobiales bacterium]